MAASSRTLLLFTTLMCVAACQDKIPEPESRPSSQANADSTQESKAPPGKAETPKTDATLVKEELTVGKGDEAKSGDHVRVHYVGTLLDGTKFDSSRDRDEPLAFTLGTGMVIKGWDQGVVGMKVGGKRKLTIPPDLAYGKTGSPPKIPPDSTLVFEVELVGIDK